MMEPANWNAHGMLTGMRALAAAAVVAPTPPTECQSATSQVDKPKFEISELQSFAGVEH